MLKIDVVWVGHDGLLCERAMQLPLGASLGDAIAACGLAPTPVQSCGIWGRVRPLTHLLQEGDRVELYQPLKVDPKFARRERFVQQGARGAGLFAKRRANSKAGY